MPPSSLRGFLAQCKSAFRDSITKSNKLTLVIGNESADLDSLTSAVLWAYVRSHTAPKPTFSNPCIPVVNIPSKDLALRPEFSHLFDEAKVEADQLVTLSDIPLDGSEPRIAPRNLKILLVDHNVLQGELGRVYGDCVRGIIDHHEDEGRHPQTHSGEEPRIIMKCGSCTSLVVEHVRDYWTGIQESSTSSREDSSAHVHLAKWCLASVLIDTVDLGEPNKVTTHDINAAEYLASIVRRCQNPGFNQSMFYQAVKDAKGSLDGVSLQGILRKDYKEWADGGVKLGISSSVKPLGYLVDKAGRERGSGPPTDAFLDGMQAHAKEQNLDIAAVMTASVSDTGEFGRELLVWAFNQQGVDAFNRFAKSSRETLGLEPLPINDQLGLKADGSLQRVAWKQGAVQYSRKKVAPMMRQAAADKS
ncbi:hypothetical protein BDY21DRAFT_346223 [Lineolata rhizophorae]|uniref:DHHA2 domain-containing protein n=1 Tax=Lineolata rhizophorae TaxID=578093 RepID=A0A6A6NYM9_9PEZI|nr:hypothetical protein BDY21DRAFT_346223 [Lineolata rhizophorae]